MKLKKVCETCEFNFSNTCAEHEGIYKYGEEIKDFSKECDAWGADVQYYSKIIEEAPWYIRKPYKEHDIDYDTFLELIEKDNNGEPINVNIYDVIEEIYDLNVIQLASILDVSVGVVTYAKNRGTITKRLDDFSKKLGIPKQYFAKCTTKDFEEIEKGRAIFNEKVSSKQLKKVKKNKSVDKIINLISGCLECNTGLATEFATISKLEWSLKTKLNKFNSVEKKMILYITSKNQLKGKKLEKFTYCIDRNSKPRLSLVYKEVSK